MKDHTTAEIFEELWKRIEYDAQVSEELASESNELQSRIDNALCVLNELYDCDIKEEDYNLIHLAINILKGSDSNE